MLLNGFPQRTPPSVRRRKLAQKKPPEIEEVIGRANALKDLLQHGLDCTCEDLSICLTSKSEACEPAGEAEAAEVDACG